MKEVKAVFLSDKKFLEAEIQGGVQLCTKEFLQYLELSGLHVRLFPVSSTRNIWVRIKVKLGLEVFSLYDFKDIAIELSKVIIRDNVNLVLINQISLSPIIPHLKRLLTPSVKFICLSHGNESGDYLHDITYYSHPSILRQWRMGSLIANESRFFKNYLNGLIVISEHEATINSWLGAKQIFYLPRLLQNEFINHQPVSGVIGFVGTLNHLPNQQGIRLLSDELVKQSFSGTLRLVGLPEAIGLELETKYPFIKYCGALNDRALVEEVSGWCVFLNPVFWLSRGSSTKLRQALNWGLPSLSTPAGSRGYDLIDKSSISESNDPSTFTSKLIASLEEKGRIEALKESSLVNVNSFDATKHSSALRRFIDQIIMGSR